MERDDSPPPVQRSGRGGGFGRYRFIAEIGRGGSAVVHLAVDQEPGESGRLVAIKELRTELRDDDDAVATFLERARTAARLNHPSLVQTLEVGRFGFRCFHAMEYVDGPTLNEVVQRARRQGLPMPLPMLLRVLTEVLAALEYAHSLVDFDGTPLGLVHRDVGLHNVVVTYGGAVKILDFGTLKVHGGKTSAGEGHGGREDAYPAPECLYGLPVDRRADVFAVGVMLWQGIVTTGAAQSKSHQLAGPDSARADIDPGLFAIVERAMTADPAGRYPTALAMRTELESHAKRARLALPDTRALAAFVLPLFVKKRQQRQAIIDTQLGILQGPGGEAPSTAAWLGLATTPAAPSMTRAARFAPDSLAPTEAATPDPGPVARETPGVTSPSAPMDVPSAQESGRGGGAGRFALAAFCGVLAAVATVLLSSGRSSPLAAEVVRGASEQGTTPPTAVRATPRPEPDEAIVSNAEPPAKAPVRRSPPSPVVAHAAPPASPPSRAAPAASVKTPAARATPASSTPLFAIDAPAAKPVRDIDKQDPYLQ